MNLYTFLSYGYDLLDLLWFRDKGLNPRDVIKSIIPNVNCKGLDLCCGSFSNGLSVAKANSYNKIIGLDISKDMLREAKRKIKKSGLDNVKLIKADATATDLKSESFDYVIIGLVLHEIDPYLRDEILAEAQRLLKKDGHLIVLEWEEEKKLLKRVKFFPLYLMEVLNCKYFKDFYKCDKKFYFMRHGFDINARYHCNYSTVLVMKKR